MKETIRNGLGMEMLSNKRRHILKVQQPAALLAKLPARYSELIEQLKKQIRISRLRVAISVNRELILLYWDLGAKIKACQSQEGWGSKVIERVSRDLSINFPDMKGFSVRNLKYMLAFVEAYPERNFVQQSAAQIPWFHNCVILEKVKSFADRIFYIQKTIENGWSRDVLVHQIEMKLHKRAGKAITNFPQTLPTLQSDLAQQVIKDPYAFDFLGIREKISERELETSLLFHLKEFLLELGVGFSFVGSQYPLEAGDQDFRLDLLFYHLNLRCFIVVDLKISAFMPEYAGKMNFYLSAVDDLLRKKGDNPSIGIILCKSKNKVIVEYALRNTKRPMGVSTYKLIKALPKSLQGKLPSSEEFSKEFKKAEQYNGSVEPKSINRL